MAKFGHFLYYITMAVAFSLNLSINLLRSKTSHSVKSQLGHKMQHLCTLTTQISIILQQLIFGTLFPHYGLIPLVMLNFCMNKCINFGPFLMLFWLISGNLSPYYAYYQPYSSGKSMYFDISIITNYRVSHFQYGVKSIHSLVLNRSRGATIKHSLNFPLISSITSMFFR